MTLCPSCGRPSPAGAKFCSECGTSLGRAQAPAHEERKVVTVLFADLVGFTSRADQMDPEDVRALLSPYYARLRSELERFGGTVEKFIGDAVMALFGAPVAHEDDPERAVRASLAIRDWVDGDDRIQIRMGVNTGEALIVLRARPAEGEGMAAGDVVNTAARLQSAAPVNGILVDERTFRATRHVIEYRQAEAVVAKGKPQPIAVWEVLRARSPIGARTRQEATTPLVGRERELNVLRGALVRLRVDRSPQLVTLVGVPGIGKSRLLHELAVIASSQAGEADPISWCEGRSLPYGSGSSFWALAEMVRAQAAILVTDPPAVADEKLSRLTSEVAPDAAAWVQRHLSRLIGGAGRRGEAGDGDRHDETFAAWRRFFEGLADRGPLVLAFEDLHWADDGLLDFIDYLVDWATGAPMLVVCTARPELLERRPGWSGGKPNAVTVSLAPLSDDDTARLIDFLIGGPRIDAARQAELLARAGGNPLYAEQYVQMLAEHGADQVLPPPESIQAIIAARLDALPPDDKRLLQDAAVIGKAFWPGAIYALGGGTARPGPDADLHLSQLEVALHRLERKQFVRRHRWSSLSGQDEYAFSHVVVRDVAYAQIPRPARMEAHLRAADWIETVARPAEQAEMVAHHYLAALHLAHAANRESAGVVPRARAALRNAGDHAQDLNAFTTAAGYYRAALELWPEDAVDDRTELLFRLAVAMFRADDDGREDSLDSARAALLAVGDWTRAAVIESHLGDVWWERGDRDRCFEHLARAQELVRDEPASAQKVQVLATIARHQMLTNFDTESARGALQVAEELALDEQKADLLITIGTARWLRGERGADEDIYRGLQIALSGNHLEIARRAYINLASCAENEGDLREALRLCDEAESVETRLGIAHHLRPDRVTAMEAFFELGQWARFAPAVDAFLAESERHARHYLDSWARLTRARLRLALGDVPGALEDQAVGLSAARLAKDPQVLYPALSVSTYVLTEAGEHQPAGDLLGELLANEPHKIGDLLAGTVIDVALAAGRLGRSGEMRQWLRACPETLWSRAARSLVDHDFEKALAVLEAIDAVRAASLARLWAARVLTENGPDGEARQLLQPALDFFHSVGATRLIREAEALSAAAAQ